ncbi:latent-transforming growth factor beta-binding protein 2-like [Mya arenaria]|uniref:latent-transforming growth factor beta-binding protein 2-like n=1 Tax=Mya arenaria TaxID=6604 RepID=UPI0022E3B30A|nr:latent-transforming growth factor beta-binding protein 2-like [Mya arenaria]
MDMKFLQCIVLPCLMAAAVADFVDSDATCTILNGQCETRCTCNEGYTHMDEQCFAKVGRSCAMNTDCVPDASCTGSTGSQTCQCPNSLVPSFYDTKCKVKVGAECKDSSDCMIHSECRTGTCACMDNYTPSSDNKTCIGYVGAECDDISQCIEHAACSGGKCKCADDYEGNKTCQKKESLNETKKIAIGVCLGFFLVHGRLTCMIDNDAAPLKLAATASVGRAKP